MANLIMMTLGMQMPEVVNEGASRVTDEPVRSEDSATEPIAPPDWNERESDDSGELMGLSRRTKGAYNVPSKQYVPTNLVTADEPHNIIIDRQVASSGTAAKREAAGIQGHGTMQYDESIEPVIREGARFGNTYFERPGSPIQSGVTQSMNPTQTDNWANSVLAARAAQNSRDAAQSSLYASLFTGN